MKNITKLELWKAFHNKYFYMSLLFGLVIALVDAIENYIIVQDLTERTLEIVALGLGSGGHSGFSLFLLSLPYNGVNYASRLYLFVWPILAAIPYGWSYSAERRSGIYYQIISRTNPRVCFGAKYIAVFISGGFAVSFPAIADILLNALICPYEVMDVSHSIASVFNGWFLSELYYTYPWVHALIWCGVLFMLGGTVAGLCFVAGAKIRLHALVVLIPFVALIVWDLFVGNVIMPMIPISYPSLLLSPLQMVIAASGLPNPEWIVLLSIIILGMLGVTIGYLRVVKSELV